MEPYPQPREIVRRGNFPYIFKITEDNVYETGWILEKPYLSKWLKISKSSRLTVKANENGYAWNGCTPKWCIFNLFVIGSPDGHIDHRTMAPFTCRASLVHDALCQFLDTVPVTKNRIDRLFLKMLGDFKLRKIYYYAAKWFGGSGVVQRGI